MFAIHLTNTASVGEGSSVLRYLEFYVDIPIESVTQLFGGVSSTPI